MGRFRPTVTVITPAFHKAAELDRAIRSVQAQDFKGAIQHVVVHDGPTPADVQAVLDEHSYRSDWRGWRVHLETGHPLGWHTLLGGDTEEDPITQERGRGCRSVSGTRAACVLAVPGPFVAYLDDDCTYEPEHLRLCVEALEADPNLGFIYGHALRWFEGPSGERVPHDVIGAYPPSHGTVDGNTIVHRVELFRLSNWERAVTVTLTDGTVVRGGDADWHLVHGWLRQGAKCQMLAAVTVNYSAEGPVPEATVPPGAAELLEGLGGGPLADAGHELLKGEAEP